jgi:hypothetical protein
VGGRREERMEEGKEGRVGGGRKWVEGGEASGEGRKKIMTIRKNGRKY